MRPNSQFSGVATINGGSSSAGKARTMGEGSLHSSRSNGRRSGEGDNDQERERIRSREGRRLHMEGGNQDYAGEPMTGKHFE